MNTYQFRARENFLSSYEDMRYSLLEMAARKMLSYEQVEATLKTLQETLVQVEKFRLESK
jgi:predicted transcriptional regulator